MINYKPGIFLAASVLVLTGVASPALAKSVAQRQGADIVRTDCAACHGSRGQGNAAAGFPRLAGNSARYLLAQLKAFANGQRKSTIMQPQAKRLTPKQMLDVATYLAGLKTPSEKFQVQNKARLAMGREIAINGIWSKNVPECMACHGPGARGTPAFPALAGQNTKYIEAQLKAFANGQRPAGPDAIMKHVARALSATDRVAVADYLASLPATGPIPHSTNLGVAPRTPDALKGYFQPPLAKDLPKGPFGKAVRRGFLIFTQTPRYAKAYVGDDLSCSNCHTNRGRQANSAPMWAAWVKYPAYRGKNKTVNNIAMRLQGCFRYSENAQASASGHFPPANSRVLIDLESYMFWMAHNAPTGVNMKGRGYKKLPQPPHPFSRTAGGKIYSADCAVCHGANGQGVEKGNGSGRFPALWGPKSFNWGAGMHSVTHAAEFIEANMPFGNPGILTIQQAWDVAAYMDSHPRPQDPRFKGNLQETIKKFHHKRADDYYGKRVDGWLLGAPGTLKRWSAQHPIRGS